MTILTDVGLGDQPWRRPPGRFFDEFAKLMNDATGVAQGVRREFETVLRTQAERILRDLDVVQREEFEAVKEMARLAREENEALKARIAALEASGPARTRRSPSVPPIRPSPITAPDRLPAPFLVFPAPAAISRRRLRLPTPLEVGRANSVGS